MTATPENFKDGLLYKKLVLVLPTFVQKPFDPAPELDVQKLRLAVKKSHEAVYKWLRNSRLTPENADALVDLANQKDNLTALKKLGRTPPTREDFLPFVFGA